MDDLPVVVLGEIFDFLNIQEKLKLRSTCKKWKFVLETFCVQQNLCIYSTEYPYNESWCWSGTRVVEEDLLYLKFNRENSRRFDLKKQFFRNLQKVYLHRIGDKVDYFLEEVHLLARLKVLMVDEIGRTKLRKLSSSSLEKCSFKGGFISTESLHPIELDMPKLHSFTLWTHSRANNHVSFRFPLALKHLECNWFDSTLNGLKNLETLICKEITTDFRLNNFKHLTRLELFPQSEEQFQVARGVGEERRRLKRDNLEMVLYGFKMEFAFNLPISFSPAPVYFGHAVRNYSHLVSQIPWDRVLSVSELLEWADSIPADFFEKFPAIRWIQACRPSEWITESEQSSLIELIKRSHTNELHIKGLKLNSGFYEQISSVLSISSLSVGPHLENVNFDHFLKLRHLRQLFVSFERISTQFICKLFEQLKLLSKFKFDSTCSQFEISIYFELLPLEDLRHELGLELAETIDFLSRPYEFLCFGAFGNRVVRKRCKDVDELVREIKRTKEVATTKDWIC